MTTRIAVAVPTNKNEASGWWSGVFGELLRTSHTDGIELEALITAGGALTDTNRNKCVDSFLNNTEADVLAFIDDDTIPPPRAFVRLLELDADIANAVYYLRGEPYNPVAYRRMPNRKYLSLKDFQPGQIVEVDSVGMGCTIVRRHVFEAIMDNYEVFMRARIAAPFPVHKDDVEEFGDLPCVVHDTAGGVITAPGGIRGYFIDPVVGPLEEGDYDRWPFYALEWGRTEDHYFNEMARRLGFTIKVDTWQECKHLGTTAHDGTHYRELVDELSNYIALRGMMGHEDPRGRVGGSGAELAGQRGNESREPAGVERAV
jgi:hypothetical protein